MKTFFFVCVSIMFALTMASHVPGHVTSRKHAKHPKVVEGGNRLLQNGFGGNDLGGGGGDDDVGDTGDMGGLGGGDVGGLGGGGLGGGLGGAGGYRALRALNDELVNDGTAMNANDEVVVAGGTVVRGGAVVARPRPRRGWYY